MSALVQAARKTLQRLVYRMGYDVIRIRCGPNDLPVDFDPEAAAIISSVMGFTMTMPERVYAFIEAVRYVERAAVPGAVVECGVAEGGSVMAAAKALLALGRTGRDLYLFDTFQGMPKPTEADVDFGGWKGSDRFEELKTGADSSAWICVPEETVRANVLKTGYPADRVHLVKGKVEDTVPDQAPEQIALLRLDTDFYESTKHELAYLYPRLAPGGILIVDDYGHWQGARKAVDEFLAEHAPNLFLSRVDYSGRIAVKPWGSARPVAVANGSHSVAGFGATN